MLLKCPDITISSVKACSNWLCKQAMRAVANGKISAFFFYKPVNVEKKH